MQETSDTQKVEESLNSKSDMMASKALTSSVNELTAYKHKDHFYSLVSHITNTLQSTISTREYYFNELSNYRNNYLVNGIYDIVANDVFVDNGDVDFISISVDKYPEVEEELNRLFERLNISSLVMSIFPDLLHNGTYYLKPIVKPGKGLVDIVDDLDPKAVISVADSKNNPLMFFISNSINNSRPVDLSGVTASSSVNNPTYSQRVSYEYLDITQVVQFSLDLNFTKLALPDKVGKHIKSKAPDYAKALLPSTLKIKTSQSLIWPVIDKLKEVLLLDKLSVYRDIGSILTPNLVGVPVPDVFDPDQLISIVKKYDELLNSNVVKINNTQNVELTMQELASVKVVPIVGDKATPQSIDIGRSAPISSQEAMEASLNRLLSSMGIPKELFTGGSDENSRSNLKTNIRYAKKIKRIQKNISRTLNFLCLLHVSEKFPALNVKSSDINIQLKNNTNVDELENQEAQDLLVASMNSVKELVDNLQELVGNSKYSIDPDRIIENIMSSFSSVGSKYHNIFRENTETSGSPPSSVADQEVTKTQSEEQQ